MSYTSAQKLFLEAGFKPDTTGYKFKDCIESWLLEYKNPDDPLDILATNTIVSFSKGGKFDAYSWYVNDPDSNTLLLDAKACRAICMRYFELFGTEKEPE